jgi:hypothetical protein
MVGMGAEKYRGKQIFDGLMHGAATVDELRLVQALSPTCTCSRNPIENVP